MTEELEPPIIEAFKIENTFSTNTQKSFEKIMKRCHKISKETKFSYFKGKVNRNKISGFGFSVEHSKNNGIDYFFN